MCQCVLRSTIVCDCCYRKCIVLAVTAWRRKGFLSFKGSAEQWSFYNAFFQDNVSREHILFVRKPNQNYDFPVFSAGRCIIFLCGMRRLLYWIFAIVNYIWRKTVFVQVLIPLNKVLQCNVLYFGMTMMSSLTSCLFHRSSVGKLGKFTQRSRISKMRTKRKHYDWYSGMFVFSFQYLMPILPLMKFIKIYHRT